MFKLVALIFVCQNLFSTIRGNPVQEIDCSVCETCENPPDYCTWLCNTEEIGSEEHSKELIKEIPKPPPFPFPFPFPFSYPLLELGRSLENDKATLYHIEIIECPDSNQLMCFVLVECPEPKPEPNPGPDPNPTPTSKPKPIPNPDTEPIKKL